MDLLKQIRDDVVDSKTDLPSVLRKAKVLASILRHSEFKQWLEYELNGYPRLELVPSYRKVYTPPLGTFRGPFGSGVENQMLPMFNMPETIHKFADELALVDGVKELEGMAKSREMLRRTWPPELVAIARSKATMTGGLVLAEVYQPIMRATIEGVIDSVRNRLLDFVLELQELTPDKNASEEALSKIPKETVSQIFNVTIQGNQNVVATGSNISQSITNSVKAHDQESLANYLQEIGIAKDDIRALQKAIEEDGPKPPSGFGERVRKWTGKMLSKAAEGTWQIALQSAPILLTEALKKYYGLQN